MKKIPLVGACVIVGLLAGKAINVSAAVAYWDPEGTFSYTTLPKGYAGSLSQSWENSKWSTVSAGTASPVAWPSGDAVCFSTGSGINTPAFTVTMNANHTFAGIFDGDLSPNSSIVTISGTGTLYLASGLQGFSIENSSDGSTGSVIINVPITGPGEVDQENSGGFALNGANSYTGGTLIDSGGGISFGNNTAFGTGTIIWGTGGFIQPSITTALNIGNTQDHTNVIETFAGNSGGVTFSGSQVLYSSGTTTLENIAQAITISGAISGSIPLVLTNRISGAGWIFSGVNTYTGATYSGGPLTISGAGSLGSGSYAGNIYIANPAAGSSGAFNYNSTAAQTLSGIISGTGPVTLNSTGSLLLSGVNTYTGATAVTNGLLSITAATGLGSTSGLTLNGGCLKNNDSTFTISSPTITAAANGAFIDAGWGTFGLTGASVMPITISSKITGSGALCINMDGSPVILSSTANDFTGGLVIGTNGPGWYSGGSCAWLKLGAAGVIPNGSGNGNVTINATYDGWLDMNGFSQTINGLSGNGGVTNSSGSATLTVGNNNATSTFSGKIITGTGTLALTKEGTGTLTLSGANTYTGVTTISAGTLDGSASGSIPGNVNNTAGVLELGNSTAMSSGATLTLASSPASSAVNLNFSGTQTISDMNWGSTSMAQGTWGATGTGAAHQNAAFTGTGLLNITSGGTAQTITFPNPGTQTYGVAPITLTATAPGGTVTYTVTSGPASVTGSQLTITGAGSVTVQANQPGTTTINAAPAVNQTFTVNPAPTTVTANSQNTPYGTAIAIGSGSTQFTANLQNSETIGSVTLSVSAATYSTNTPAGTYTLTPSAAAGGTFNPANYNITYATNSLVVQPVALIVTASSESKNYGQTYTGVGTAKTTNFTATGFVNGVTTAAMTVTLAASGSPSGDTAAAPIGGYTLTASAAAPAAGNAGSNFLASDYTITYNTGTLTVSLAPATVTANSQTITYGTVVITNGSTAFTSTLSNGETIGSVTLSLSGTNVGTNIITPSAATGGSGTEANYTITYVTNSLIVNPLPVVLTGTRPYDGTNDATNTILSVSNVVGGDDISVASGSGVLDSADIGTNAITSTGTLTLGGAASNNYTLTGASGSVIVTTLPIVLTGTRLYDGTTNASSSILSVWNAAPGDDVTVASGDAGLASADIGTNAITSIGTLALGGTTATNYTLTGAGGEVTVTPLPVVLTGTRTYDGTNDAASTILTVANAIPGDDVAAASGSATLASANAGLDAISSAGTLELGGTTATNYTLDGASGSITVTPLSVVLTGARLYDGTALATNAILTVANAFAGDDVNVSTVPGYATLASASVGPETITGFANLTLSGVTGPDYTLSGASGSVVISNPNLPFTITSSALDVTRTNLVVCWQSVPGVTYYVLTNASLALSHNWQACGGGITASDTNTCYTLPGGIFGNTNVFLEIGAATNGF